jgi:hypothetical protein
MLDSRTAEYGGEMLYINKSAAKHFGQLNTLATKVYVNTGTSFLRPFTKTGLGPRYRDQDASAYNRNQDSHAIEDVVRGTITGASVRVLEDELMLAASILFSPTTNTHSRGAENYRRSGEVDAMRIPKDGFLCASR